MGLWGAFWARRERVEGVELGDRLGKGSSGGGETVVL